MQQTVPAEESFLDLVGRVTAQTGLQSHELVLYCYPPSANCANADSLALFQQPNLVRELARINIESNIVVISLLSLFALFFIHALNQINLRMLHPLWSILDDMASLRFLEVVCMARFQPGHKLLVELRHACKKRRRLQSVRNWIKKRLYFSEEQVQMQDAAELVELARSLAHMRSALRSWAKYVPPYVLKSLYRSGREASLGVEFREVSVMFCDIHNFKSLCRGQAPKVVMGLLSIVHSEVSDAIENAGGTLLEFIGDEILAVFNAPIELSDHCGMAVMAAVGVWERSRKLNVRLRCGLNCARVLVGNIGSVNRIKYGVLGDGVNVAARLKSLNAHYGTQCLVSGACLREVAHQTCLARPIGHLILKGRKEPTKVFEVLGHRPGAVQAVVRAFDAHSKAFQLYQGRCFAEAKALFAEVNATLTASTQLPDLPSQHLIQMCDKFLAEPPPNEWDGSEKLASK